MSVINDMLRDLDKRKAPEVGGSHTAPQESLIEAQSSVYPKIVIIVLLILLASLLAYFFINGKGVKTEPDQEITKSSELLNVHEEQRALESDKIIADKQPLIKLAEREENKQTSSTIEQSIAKRKNEKQTIQKKEKQKLEAAQERTARIIEEPTKTETIKTSKKESLNLKPLTASFTDNTVISKNSKDEVAETKQLAPSEEHKNAGVKLSPIALDQKMAEQALVLISQHKESEAYRELYAFIGAHDEDMESRTVLASYLLKENRIAEVGDVLLNAPLNKSPKLRQIKARWYAEKGEHKLALYTLNSELPRVEKYPEYYVLLAAYYQRYGTAQEAKEIYSTLVDYDETVADWWAGLGLASDRNNEKEKAVYAYKQALDLKGLSSELLNFVKPRLNQLLAVKQNQ